jgi:uncharacterized low-complexity protein
MKASIIIPVASAALLFCAVTAAAAQDRPSAVDPKGCAPGERLQTDGKAPDGKAGEPLSDKLARTDGVICPPNVDPEIRAPTPQSGNKMPVIPPPGSPGGDQSIQPK